jgi:hypothetical protein
MYNIQRSILILIDAIKTKILTASPRKKSINFFLILQYKFLLIMITWISICLIMNQFSGKNISSLTYFRKLCITLMQHKLFILC